MLNIILFLVSLVISIGFCVGLYFIFLAVAMKLEEFMSVSMAIISICVYFWFSVISGVIYFIFKFINKEMTQYVFKTVLGYSFKISAVVITVSIVFFAVSYLIYRFKERKIRKNNF